MAEGKNSDTKIQWHQAFVGAIHCELMEDQEKLIFEQEYSITKKPLQIDLLIIKKRSDAQFGSGTGRLLSGYNILEYKSPGDALGIDELFQALTYACYYKCSAAYVDERKESDITIMLIRNEYPAALIRFLEGKRCTMTEQEPGIYRVIGNTFFRLVILVTGKMDQESYLWLNSLRGDLEKSEYMNLLRRSNEIGTSEGDYSDAVLSVVELSNRDCIKWKEESAVASYLAEAKREGISIGEKRGISIGEKRGISIGEKRGISIGEKRGISIGEKRGISIGEQNRARATAVILLQGGKLSAEEIAGCTGLSVEQVLGLGAGGAQDTARGDI